jgi:phage major head subunit gpT-like protein
MKTLNRTAAAVLGALAIAGCAAPHSQAPLATNFPTTQQEKLQAAAHWEVISADMAREVMAALPTPLASNLYVHTGQESAFNRAVEDQLITAMVRGGYSVATRPEGALSVEIDTQVIEFSEDRAQNKWIGLPTALVTGAWAVRTLSTEATAKTTAAATVTAGAIGWDVYRWFRSQSASGPTPKTEIVVNVSVSDDTRYLARSTHIYYVSDSDRALYDAAATTVFLIVGAR